MEICLQNLGFEKWKWAMKMWTSMAWMEGNGVMLVKFIFNPFNATYANHSPSKTVLHSTMKSSIIINNFLKIDFGWHCDYYVNEKIFCHQNFRLSRQHSYFLNISKAWAFQEHTPILAEKSVALME